MTTDGTAEYVTGSGLVILRGRVAVLLTGSTGPEVARECYAAAGAPDPVEAVLALFLKNGLYAAPQFAIARRGAHGEPTRVVLRGRLHACVRSADGEQVIAEPRGIADRDYPNTSTVEPRPDRARPRPGGGGPAPRRWGRLRPVGGSGGRVPGR